MTFGEALEELKRGGKVARKSWNGKGMFLFLSPGNEIMTGQLRADVAEYYYQSAEQTMVKFSPRIDMKAADNTIVIGWLASQTDMLADDWEIVD